MTTPHHQQGQERPQTGTRAQLPPCSCYFDPATQRLIRSPHCPWSAHAAIARGERSEWEPRDPATEDVTL
jgi:hypothetical protein